MTSAQDLAARRVTVTGGCGFVGARLVRKLVELGATVSVLDDFSLGTPDNFGDFRSSIEVARVDIRDSDATALAFARLRPNYVIHLAAVHFIPACDRDPKRCVDVNTGGTQSVLDASAASSVDAVVLSSTAAVYAPGTGAHGEGSAIGPTDIYGLTKLWMEQLGELFHRRTQTPVGVARLFNVFGPGETNPHLIPVVIDQAQKGGTLHLGNLTTSRDYVFVDDVAEALLGMIAPTWQSGRLVCNVGRGEEFNGQEIVSAVGEILGSPLDVHVDPARLRASDRPNLLSDSSLALSLLGWRATTDLHAGLRAALGEPFAASLGASSTHA